MSGWQNDPLKASHLHIEFVKGSVAPRYEETDTELRIVKAVITEEGMSSGRPLVDFVFEDAQGKKYYTMASGRIFTTLAAAVHGVEQKVSST